MESVKDQLATNDHTHTHTLSLSLPPSLPPSSSQYICEHIQVLWYHRMLYEPIFCIIHIPRLALSFSRVVFAFYPRCQKCQSCRDYGRYVQPSLKVVST